MSADTLAKSGSQYWVPDPLAMAVAIDGSVVTQRGQHYATVSLSEGPTLGQIVHDVSIHPLIVVCLLLLPYTPPLF